jgi:ATP-binding cassette subfamily B (MDR/TAP) protein 1
MTVINGGGEYPPRSKTSMFWNRKHDLKEEAEEEMGYIAREEKNFNFSTSSLPSPTSPTSAGAKDGLHAKFDTSPRRSSGAHVSDLSLQFNSLNSRNHQRPTNHSSPSIITTTSEPSIYDKEEKEEEREFEMQKWAITNSGKEASRIRELRKAMSVEGMNGLPSPRVDWRRSGKGSLKEIKIDEEPTNEAPKEKAAPSIVKLIRIYFPTLPRSAKFSIFFGLLFAVLSGAMTPLFSFLLATLLAELGNPLKSLTYISHFALFVLLVAAIDGLASGAKFYLLEDAAMVWVCSLRNRSYEKVLKQDKAFFDKDENSPDKIVQLLMKDGDDARTLVATILGQFVVVVTMMSVGIIWALVVGWQLTLVGCAIGPLFAGAMMGQSILLGRFELRNKRAREGVAKQYYTVSCIYSLHNLFGS